MRSILTCLLLFSMACSAPSTSAADLTPEQKKELSALSKSLRDAKTLARKKQFDELRAAVAAAETKLGELEIAADERDRTYRAVLKSLDLLKAAIPVSFETEVAPIIKEKCIRCHGASRKSGQLRLDTYANMGRGGANGPLVRGNLPRNSLLMARLMTPNPQQRMPKDGEKLPDEQLAVIARWISQGSLYDGTDPTAEIGSAAAAKPEKPVKIARPDGSETVSFKNDIAPWMVNVCLGCHGDRNPRNGFSLATFERMLRGGESGPPIVPGDPDNSYIVDLVLRQDPLKMPAGNQTRIKRSQAVALETWVREGAKFDGGDPKAPLRNLVPTPAELEARRLAAMTKEEFSARRLQQGTDLWERVLPRDEVLVVTSPNFYVFATDKARGQQMSEWAEADAARIRETFDFGDGELWRGRLNIFVGRDRFAYEEFNQVVFNRQTPKDMIGHAVVTSGFTQAYIVIQDVGDEVSEQSPGVRTSLTAQLGDAYARRGGNDPPALVARGVGLLLASQSTVKNDPWFAALPQRLKGVAVARPQDIFDDGSFTPGELDAAAFLFAKFLTRASQPRYVLFIKELQSTGDLAAAARKVYRQTPAEIGAAFLRQLR